MKKALLVIDMQNVCVGEKHATYFKYDNENLIQAVNKVIDENNSSVVDEVGGAIDTQLQEQESKLLELIEKKIEDILFVVITTIFVETCDRMISSLDM